MSVAVLITDAQQSSQLIPWGARFARARDTDLVVIIPRRGNAPTQWSDVDIEQDDSAIGQAIAKVAIAEGLANTTDNVSLAVRELTAKNPGWELAEEVHGLHITLLIIPPSLASKAQHHQEDWQRNLFRNAPCDTVYLRDDAHQNFDQLHVAVVVTGEDNDPVAVKYADSLAEQNEGMLTAIYVGPDVDQVSPDVGYRILDRVVMAARGDLGAHIQRRVVLADSLIAGIHEFDVSNTDLILFGSRWQRDARRILDGNLFPSASPETVPAVGVIRGGLPLGGRLLMRLRRFVQRHVPQLDREHRVSLVERIQSNSAWDFDFIALLCLSTLIAGLGLIRNSASVVIGAMLVAPLMTPIVGAGLGLAHGNVRLIKSALQTVLRGFATAFVIGIVLGLLTSPEMTSEIESRGAPTFLDLVVALVSGVAAAYALGRPNLLSALPGVAIAAALVPPLAASGIALSLGDWWHAKGALLLFLTNIVAIILGTTTTFWSVGIRPEKPDKPTVRWPLWTFVGLVALTVGLTALVSLSSS
ncbi:MAG: TIGR00341 family protein [Planctomycetaceae bacterium]|nr:TIGR00341 family protein [Planctomycetaceae bacterium]